LAKQATYAGPRQARRVETFTTGADLRGRSKPWPAGGERGVSRGGHWGFRLRQKSGSAPARQFDRRKSGKISTREGTLLAELVPTSKIVADLRDWFPQARIVAWKYRSGGRP